MVSRTGTTSRAPLRATACNSPVVPGLKSVWSKAICQRCRPAIRDSSRMSVTTAVNPLISSSPSLTELLSRAEMLRKMVGSGLALLAEFDRPSSKYIREA
jgi:hypothetical protein